MNTGSSSDNGFDRVAAGLDLFAAAWLEEWLIAGGSVSLEEDGSSMIGHPASHQKAPDYLPPAAHLSEEAKSKYDTFCDGRYIGRMRALGDLLEKVPGGREALKAHMRSHGMRYCIGSARASA